MDHFFARFFRQRGERVPPIPPAIRTAFMWHSWPGNVRELENLCERIALTCGGRLDAGCLPAALLQADGAAHNRPGLIEAEPAPAVQVPTDDEVLEVSLDDRLHELEAHLISWALRATSGNKSRAAQLLKIKRSTLNDRINRCGLGVPTAAPTADKPREMRLATA